MAFPYREIEKKIGYIFQNKSLVEEAFTHSTYANRYGGKDNERMEYLGDAVLQMVVTEWQYARNERAEEGFLTRERQTLVCEDALYQAVKALDVEKYLLFEGGKSNVGKKTVSSLFETLTAAIYLDGGYQAAKKFVLQYGVFSSSDCAGNPKGELQEYLQKRGESTPTYFVEKQGPDNAPTFVAKAQASGITATAQGGSKKEAEAKAAAELLKKLIAKHGK